MGNMYIKVSQEPIIHDKTGGYVYIITPNGLGGFDPYQISVSDLLSGASDSGIKMQNISGNQSVNIPADSFIDDFQIVKISGTPVIKCGTSANGDDVFLSQTISDFLILDYSQEINTSTILYFTLSGGEINLRISLRLNNINT